MRVRIGELTFSAMMAALAVLLVLLASVLPGIDLTVTAVAGICPALAQMRFSTRAGIMTWVAASLLGLLFATTREMAVVFTVMFGLYPMIKRFCEKYSLVTAWGGKLLFANAAMAVIAGFSLLFFPMLLDYDFPLWGLWLLYNVAFVIYDVALARLSPFLSRLLKFDKR